MGKAIALGMSWPPETNVSYCFSFSAALTIGRLIFVAGPVGVFGGIKQITALINAVGTVFNDLRLDNGSLLLPCQSD
jgi:hypothetical protein